MGVSPSATGMCSQVRTDGGQIVFTSPFARRITVPGVRSSTSRNGGKVLTRQVSPVITSEPVAGTGMPNPATEPSRMKPTCGSAKDVPPMKVSWGKIVVPNAATAVPSEVVAENPHPTLSATKMVSLPCPDLAASAGAAISSAIGPRFEMTTERLKEGTYGSGHRKGVAGGRANTRIP